MGEGDPTHTAEGAPADAERDRFFDLAVELTCVAGLDGRFKRLNAAWERTLGFSLDELMERPILAFVHPDDHRATRKATRTLLSGVDLHGFESRYLCADGSCRWLSWRCRGLRPGEDVLYAVARDITDVRLARADLERSTSELEAIFRALPDLLFHTDAAGRIVHYFAGRSSDLYAPPTAFLGRTFVDVLPAEPGAALLDAVRRAHASGSVAAVEYQLPFPPRIERFEARCVPLRDAETVTLVRNVTERWQAEEALLHSQERLRQSEKLEAIGRVAGSIAHDFNNLMMVVLSYTSLLLSRLGPDDPQAADVTEIRRAGERATALTRQLLALGRRQLLRPSRIVPGAVVSDMEPMLTRLIGEDVALTTSVAAEPWRVLVDPTQLQQVVLNLALNARDAMPRGGALRIATENVAIDDACARRLDAPGPGAYVRLSVSDTGLGIDAPTRARLFEPFFTTKPPGSGTGLGLATVYGIVRQSNGCIEVESEPGAGATFAVLFPRATGAIDAAPASAPATSERRRGDETVLVVEDERAVRRAVVEVLESLGYRVLEAGDAEAARAIAREHRGPIHLLLTDVVMPARGGRELAFELAAERPTLVTLFMSGYAPPGGSGPAIGAADLLEKPFEPDVLARRVRAALDRAARE